MANRFHLLGVLNFMRGKKKPAEQSEQSTQAKNIKAIMFAHQMPKPHLKRLMDGNVYPVIIKFGNSFGDVPCYYVDVKGKYYGQAKTVKK